jgi:hypothetical protein
MKNIFMLVAFFFLLGSTVSIAQTAQPELRKAEQVEQQKSEDRKEISADKLPAAALATLQSDQFEGWKVEKAYKVKRGDRKVYEVTLTNGVDVVTALFDENGNLLG